MRKIAVGFEINDHTDEDEILLFLDSLNEFGGDLSDIPIYIMKPEGSEKLSDELLKKIEEYRVNLKEYPIKESLLKFIFTDKVVASAELEESLEGEVDILAWLAPDTLFINEPVEFHLKEGKYLGYRPVHHKLIGSSHGEPLDEFWKKCYDLLGVDEEDVFPMSTCVGEKVRPYFNSGFLIVRPEKKILRTWKDNFLDNFNDDTFRSYYQKDVRYIVFVHQIILSATIITMLDKGDMTELSSNYNYPLNLLSDIPEDERPGDISELVTARYDDFHDFFVKKKLHKLINIDDPYKRWFKNYV